MVARQRINEAETRLFELNRESVAPEISLVEPAVQGDSTLKFARNKNTMALRGKIKDDSELRDVIVNNTPAAFFKTGESWEFRVDLDVSSTDFITIKARTYMKTLGR
jgi:hypothetical protein